MLNGTINGIQQGVNSLSTQLCNCCGDLQMALANGFAGVNAGMAAGFNGVNMGMMGGFNDLNMGMMQGFNAAEVGANARATAAMQQAFNQQVATMQGFDGVQSQLANCCCENRLATANQTATILAEHCSDRAALSDGVRDIIQSNTANTQLVLDKLCALELQGVQRELDAERRTNASLQNQLNMANLAASQAAQTAQLLQGQNAEVDALYNRLASCPVPTMPVYGNQPVFTCQQRQCNCNGIIG